MRAYLSLRDHHFSLSKKEFLKLKVSLNKKQWEHRWMDLSSLHIPIVGLKDFGRDKLEVAIQRLEVLKNDKYNIDLKVNGVWAYPDQFQARLLWIGVQQSRELLVFQDRVKELLRDLCEEDEDRRAIIPLVRFKNYHNVTDVISPYKGSSFGHFNVNCLLIHEMVKGGAFPTIKQIYSVSLNSGNSDDSTERGMNIAQNIG